MPRKSVSRISHYIAIPLFHSFAPIANRIIMDIYGKRSPGNRLKLRVGEIAPIDKIIPVDIFCVDGANVEIRV